MVSEVSICNMALVRIGIPRSIASLDEQSQEAVTCNAVYATCRDLLLERVDWPFARRRIALGLVEEDPNDDWGYSYRYPSQCAAIRRIVTGTRAAADPNPPPFEIASDDTGLLVHTDQADAAVEYTALITNTAMFSESFASLLSWAVAKEIAVPLTVSPEMIKNAKNGYAEGLATAVMVAECEQRRDEAPDSEFIRARG